MNAIAGCVAIDEDSHTRCEAILQRLTPYGNNAPRLKNLDRLSFGYISSGRLPEDEFDQQPLVGPGGLVLLADARLDNRQELASQLSLNSSRLAEAQLLLECWTRWGRQTLDHIVGDFAFAVFDPARQELTLARDPTGQRPLFFTQVGGGLAFASTPSALLADRPEPSGFNLPRLALTLNDGLDLTQATNFANICRVLPGHVAVFRDGKMRQESYWEPPRDFLRLRDQEYVEAYRETLATAVRAQSRRKSGPLAVQLSSGWDSSAVAATAARIGESPVAFTSAPGERFTGGIPPGRIADETDIAAQTARLHGIEHHIVRPTDGPLNQLRRLARSYQEPDYNVVNLEWWTAIQRAAREQSISTMLTGQLGNLTLNAGGLLVLAEWIRVGRFGRWLQEARAAKEHSTASWRGILYNSFREWLPETLQNALERSAGLALESDQGFVRREWAVQGRRYAGQVNAPVASRPYALRRHWLRAQDYGMFRAGALADGGISERDPLADRRVIDFSFQLPPEQLLSGGEWRPLARRALRGLVPDSVLDLRHRGYQGADWFERVRPSELHALLDEISSSHAAAELLDLPKLRSTIERWPSSGPTGYDETALYRTRLLMALSTGVFLQEFEALPASASVSGSLTI